MHFYIRPGRGFKILFLLYNVCDLIPTHVVRVGGFNISLLIIILIT